MDSSNLTPEQADQLRQVIGRQLRYLNKLCGRMQIKGWPLDDPICAASLSARDAIQKLFTACQGAGQRRMKMPVVEAGGGEPASGNTTGVTEDNERLRSGQTGFSDEKRG